MAYARDEMRLLDSDLTAYARIRNAALEGFATNGVAATSIRDVAQAAGVSPGLVQHHFSTKAALRDAVNEYVAVIAQQAFGNLAPDSSSSDAIGELGQRIAALVRDDPTALLYVARLVLEGDEAALALFDGFVEIAKQQLARLAADGLLQEDLDLEWAALHVVVFNLGTLLMENAVSRHLPEAFFGPKQLARWGEASTKLFRSGISSAEAPPETAPRDRRGRAGSKRRTARA
jgi:AcrR family transcriptional regulator